MKYLLPILLFFSVLCTSLTAVEYGYLSSETESNSVTLNDGDYIEFLGGDSDSGYAIHITLPNGASFAVHKTILGLDHVYQAGFQGADSTKMCSSDSHNYNFN